MDAEWVLVRREDLDAVAVALAAMRRGEWGGPLDYARLLVAAETLTTRATSPDGEIIQVTEKPKPSHAGTAPAQ